jgi:hypothetical protein
MVSHFILTKTVELTDEPETIVAIEGEKETWL